MAGMLYLCATPIGNLEDITFRVLRTLKEVDLIAAEDTRNSQKLLNHFDIHTPMTSYHEYNKYDKAEYLVGLMLDGKNIACITDAGTPGISDPGEVLVQKCYEAGIKVTSLPGPAACITALTMSGLSTRRFAFEAFLPADKKQRAQILEELQDETRTIILYEAPHHLVKTLVSHNYGIKHRELVILKVILLKEGETLSRSDHNISARRLKLSGQDLEESRLTGTVCTDQTITVSLCEFDVDILKESFLANTQCDIIC